jgi:protein-tyrosine phosphatase
MGEALLQRRLDERAIAARVHSAGFLEGGAPATQPAIEAMAAEGLDISGHSSRRITPYLIDEADLVVTMTRQHLIELALQAPDDWNRVFQLRDLVRRAEQVGPRPRDEPFTQWLSAVGDGRTRAGLLATSLSDDVEDPVGQPAAAYDRTKKLLDDLFTRLAALI